MRLCHHARTASSKDNGGRWGEAGLDATKSSGGGGGGGRGGGNAEGVIRGSIGSLGRFAPVKALPVSVEATMNNHVLLLGDHKAVPTYKVLYSIKCMYGVQQQENFKARNSCLSFPLSLCQGAHFVGAFSFSLLGWLVREPVLNARGLLAGEHFFIPSLVLFFPYHFNQLNVILLSSPCNALCTQNNTSFQSAHSMALKFDPAQCSCQDHLTILHAHVAYLQGVSGGMDLLLACLLAAVLKMLGYYWA
eukprot:1136595-Pelagomonas_calceolata.AAC.2